MYLTRIRPQIQNKPSGNGGNNANSELFYILFCALERDQPDKLDNNIPFQPNYLISVVRCATTRPVIHVIRKGRFIEQDRNIHLRHNGFTYMPINFHFHFLGVKIGAQLQTSPHPQTYKSIFDFISIQDCFHGAVYVWGTFSNTNRTHFPN